MLLSKTHKKTIPRHHDFTSQCTKLAAWTLLCGPVVERVRNDRRSLAFCVATRVLTSFVFSCVFTHNQCVWVCVCVAWFSRTTCKLFSLFLLTSFWQTIQHMFFFGAWFWDGVEYQSCAAHWEKSRLLSTFTQVPDIITDLSFELMKGKAGKERRPPFSTCSCLAGKPIPQKA